MENETKPMSTKDLTVAVQELLAENRAQAARQQRKRRQRVRRKQEQVQASITKLHQSIEVIKWCIVGITVVMFLSLTILVIVVWQIGNEATRIKSEVEVIKGEAEKIVTEIGDEADKIRDKLQNPLHTIHRYGNQKPREMN